MENKVRATLGGVYLHSEGWSAEKPALKRKGSRFSFLGGVDFKEVLKFKDLFSFNGVSFGYEFPKDQNNLTNNAAGQTVRIPFHPTVSLFYPYAGTWSYMLDYSTGSYVFEIRDDENNEKYGNYSNSKTMFWKAHFTLSPWNFPLGITLKGEKSEEVQEMTTGDGYERGVGLGIDLQFSLLDYLGLTFSYYHLDPGSAITQGTIVIDRNGGSDTGGAQPASPHFFYAGLKLIPTIFIK